MHPPPIGEALSEGWKATKEHLGVMIVGMLLTILVGNIPFIGQMLGFAGMSVLALKAVRGQKPEVGEFFAPFSQFVDIVVIGLLRIVGLILCCFGIYISEGIFFQGTFLVIDKKVTWTEAKDTCMKDIVPHWISWTIFYFVILFTMSLLGTLLCIIGIFVTIPIAFCAMAYAYEKSYGGVSNTNTQGTMVQS